VFPVSRQPFWFLVELGSSCEYVTISSGDFDNLKNKRSNVEFAFNGDLQPFNSHHVYHILTKKSSSSPLLSVTLFDNGLDCFENLNVIPSRFDGSKNKPKRNVKCLRVTEIFKKNEGAAAFAAPAVRRLKKDYFDKLYNDSNEVQEEVLQNLLEVNNTVDMPGIGEDKVCSLKKIETQKGARLDFSEAVLNC